MGDVTVHLVVDDSALRRGLEMASWAVTKFQVALYARIGLPTW